MIDGIYTTLPPSSTAERRSDSWQAKQIYEYHQGNYWISTDPARFDLGVIHGFLQHSYWSPGIPREIVAAAVRNSYCFGLFDQDQQIGFLRVVTDFASVAYIADVFVLPHYRGQGLGTWLIECVTTCPPLHRVRNFLLATRDAHELYRKVGFETIQNPERWMIHPRPPAWRRPEMIIESTPPPADTAKPKDTTV
jgi:ribosomal protein S18 acetylase RimI-like enzyme